MTTRINDVEVAHDQALIYEEIHDARLKDLFAPVVKAWARVDASRAEQADLKKTGRQRRPCCEARGYGYNGPCCDDGEYNVLCMADETTMEIALRWFKPYRIH